MLSYYKGKPIAIIKGGARDGCELGLYDPSKKCCEKCKGKCSKRRGFCCETCIADKCYKGASNERSTMSEMVMLKGDGSKFEPLPNCETTFGERGMVCGPTGSGKSTYASNYAKQYKKMFPNNKIIIFSGVKEDKVLDKLDPIRIEINESLINDPMQKEELNNSLCIFDDIETIRPTSLKKAVHELLIHVQKEGRKQNIYVLLCSHQFTRGVETRDISNESNYITFFPSSGSRYGITYYLNKYVGIPNDTIRRIMKLPSRWVTVYKTYPMYVLYETGCFLLSNMEEE